MVLRDEISVGLLGEKSAPVPISVPEIKIFRYRFDSKNGFLIKKYLTVSAIH
jgi:hypothetical protein